LASALALALFMQAGLLSSGGSLFDHVNTTKIGGQSTKMSQTTRQTRTSRVTQAATRMRMALPRLCTMSKGKGRNSKNDIKCCSDSSIATTTTAVAAPNAVNALGIMHVCQSGSRWRSATLAIHHSNSPQQIQSISAATTVCALSWTADATTHAIFAATNAHRTTILPSTRICFLRQTKNNCLLPMMQQQQ